jgi:hypothetical protein
MDNPSLILQTVDRRLDHAVRLVLYGRAALWLGFNSAPPEAAKTQDVDAIISVAQSEELAADPQFWDAVRSWRQHLVSIDRLLLRWLKLFRPATLDLILTKMMRGNDPQDMADAKFMIAHDQITRQQLEEAFAVMNPIELVELREAFAKARPIVFGFARD